MLDYLRARDMILTAYCPLARGAVKNNPLLVALAKKYGKDATQIALRWLIQQGNVAAIPKATSAEHLKSNLDIFDFNLDDDEMARIHALARPDGRLINPKWSPAWDNAA